MRTIGSGDEAIQGAQLQKLADESYSARTGLSENQVRGNHQPVEKCQANGAFKEGGHRRNGVNRGLARKPVLKRGSRHAVFLRKLPLGNGLVWDRFKSGDFGSGRGAIPS